MPDRSHHRILSPVRLREDRVAEDHRLASVKADFELVPELVDVNGSLAVAQPHAPQTTEDRT